MVLKLLRLALVPFALLCVGLVRLLGRFGVLIRFGVITSHRLGHMLGDMECYLCERDAGIQPKAIDLWAHGGPVANKAAARLLWRELSIDPTKFVLMVNMLNQLFQGWEKHCIRTTQVDRDIHNLFEKRPPHFKFSEDELMRGEQTLREWGVPAGAKWVCIIQRDSAYLPQLGYHSHRDSKIETYMGAAYELAKRGYYVFRMGANTTEQLLLKHSKVFDYARNGMRSDFMDLYLGAHCEFCVSNGCGFDAIPHVFRRPICYVNIVPVEYLMTFVNPSLAIFKHHVKDGKRLTPAEIYDANLGQCMAASDYVEAKVTLEDNSPLEITEVVMEMADLVERKLIYRQREQGFWNEFPRSISPFNGKPLHGEIRMRIGAKFLEQYQ